MNGVENTIRTKTPKPTKQPHQMAWEERRKEEWHWVDGVGEELGEKKNA